LIPKLAVFCQAAATAVAPVNGDELDGMLN
jgi:hypothetical protein